MKANMRRTETAQTHFLRAVAGYGMANVRRNEDIRQELGITDIVTATKAIKLNGKGIWKHA
jgi:hypothetical protein